MYSNYLVEITSTVEERDREYFVAVEATDSRRKKYYKSYTVYKSSMFLHDGDLIAETVENLIRKILTDMCRSRIMSEKGDTDA